MQALWMLLASFFFASMGVCVKLASDHFNSFEIVFYRGLIGVLFILAMTRVRGVSLRTQVPWMHAWRSVVGVTALTAWFYAIANLPLATAVTLNYMSSMWIATFLLGGALLMQKRQMPLRQQAPLFLTVLIGFGGVALILRPSFNPEQMVGALAGLLSGIFSAFAYLQVAALARAGEPESRTVFYFCVGAVAAGALGMVFAGASPWLWPSVLWLLPVGLLAVLGQLCMTRAYTRGATMVVANLHYAGILFASIYGITLFGDRPGLTGWIGMGLIIVSGITATALRARAVPYAPAEDH